MDNEKAEKIISLLSELNENIVLMQKIQFASLFCLKERNKLFIQLAERDEWDTEIERDFQFFKNYLTRKDV